MYLLFSFATAGETIDAKAHDNVTILFSDIVGFTSICSTTTPFTVINMLEDLYSQFDEFCGQLDVYKVNKRHKKRPPNTGVMQRDATDR